MIASILASFGPQIAAALAALAALAGVFFYGRKKGADAEKVNTAAVQAQFDAHKAAVKAADAQADAEASKAVSEAVQQRQAIDEKAADLKPGSAQQQLQDQWSRD